MFQSPEGSHNLSMWLSQVLQDIGVTETMVKKRKRTWMINEAIANTTHFLLDEKLTSHFIGSQSEASTTLGLKSDVDCLEYPHDIQVIQDWSQWQPDTKQYLMVQDETVSPGYCLLQLLRRDAPLPVYDINFKHHLTDIRGRVLLRHSFCVGILEGTTKHGPAHLDSSPGRYDHDFVMGLYCPSWPKEALPWLQQQNNSGWPTEQMKRYLADQGCFVVPVGSKQCLYQNLEWRISTSLAERRLMYDLNITQIRCYILMKMVLKTFLKPICGEAVSTFMCKNILFYRIAGSEVNSTWNESSLLTRLNQCLQALLHCIQTENCPHYMIPRNNLLSRKLSAKMKRQLADVMCNITGNIKQSLLGIQIDNLGRRLHDKICGISTVYLRSADHNVFLIAHQLIYIVSGTLQANINIIQRALPQNGDANVHYLINIVSKLGQLYREGGESEKVTVSLLKPFLCTTIGSIKASADIHHSRNISLDALKWFSRGLNSDVSSSKLKKASALYCASFLQSCEIILTDVSRKLSHRLIKSICCSNLPQGGLLADLGKLCYEKNEDAIKHNMAACITFTKCEINCIPGQLKYEMFRSTEEERQNRHPVKDFWMDWAVVDSKPYLYFLQYKVYSQLHRPADQHRALENLARTINTESNLGHRETALNLLGQCMEQENRPQDALNNYMASLTIRRQNNAAKWHVCMLLARLVRNLPK